MARSFVGVRRASFRGGGSQRRQTLWLSSVTTVATIAPATPILLTSLNAAALSMRPFTVVRTRGNLTLESDQSVASEFYEAAYGDIVVSDEAVAAGVASVPTPVAQDASDWHVYARTSGIFEFGDATGFQTAGGQVMQFDSKAMRKVDLGEDLIGVVEGAAPGLGSIIRVYVRTLIKLH